MDCLIAVIPMVVFPACVYDVCIYIYIYIYIYRMSINSLPDYKHLLQENYCMWNTVFFFLQNVTQEVFLQRISTLQHVLLLLHGERLIDNQFLSACSPTCLQLL